MDGGKEKGTFKLYLTSKATRDCITFIIIYKYLYLIMFI